MPVKIVDTRELSRRFRDVLAVDAVTMTVETGETFGLLGPNGAGKTTVIKMLTTMLKPTSGFAAIAGFDVTRKSEEVRRLIGYVPQMISVDGGLTARENLLVFARLYDVPRAERKARIDDALELVGLTGDAHRLVRTYSGGMIRRLEIAEAMLHRPPMLFLDEPTVGLDPIGREAVWDRIEQLRAELGTTILLTTHYMEEAEQLCSRVAIMHRGCIAAIGAPSELIAGLGVAEATLDDVFERYAGGKIETGGGYRDAARTRRTLRRLG